VKKSASNTIAYANENDFLCGLWPENNRFTGGRRVRERGRLVCATGLTQNLAGVTGTFTTLTSNPKFPTKITQAVAARIDRFPYMVVSNTLTNAYVHKSPFLNL